VVVVVAGVVVEVGLGGLGGGIEGALLDVMAAAGFEIEGVGVVSTFDFGW
jgi:hypothetical protein